MGTEYAIAIQHKQTIWHDTAEFYISKAYAIANAFGEFPESHIRPVDVSMSFLVDKMDREGYTFVRAIDGVQFMSIPVKDHSSDDLRPWEIRWLNAIAAFLNAAIPANSSFTDIRVILFAD